MTRGHAITLRWVTMWAVAAVWLPNHAAAEPPGPEVKLAQVIEDYAPELGGDTVVVVPFLYSDGIKSIEGALFAERVETLLAERGRVRVVDRAELDRIMEEQKLSASGLVDPATHVRVGKLLGARGMLTGTVTDLGETIEVHARLTNVESAEVVATFSDTTRKTIKTFISPLWNRIEKIKTDSPAFNVELWPDVESAATETPGLPTGSFVTFQFRADRDCYVTIFDFTTSGSIHVLFPNAMAPDNHIRANRTYTFPDPEAGFKIRVNGPPGIERLKLFATTNDISLFDEDYSQESFRSVTEDSYDVTRDLEAVIMSLESNAWGESHVELRIEQTIR